MAAQVEMVVKSYTIKPSQIEKIEALAEERYPDERANSRIVREMIDFYLEHQEAE